LNKVEDASFLDSVAMSADDVDQLVKVFGTKRGGVAHDRERLLEHFVEQFSRPRFGCFTAL
jgi:hypothetical protein